jgi:SnoaL-like protein
MRDELHDAVEKANVVDVLTELFLATDRRDWEAVKRCFAPQVLFDMSSLTGAPASTVAAEEIAAGWEQGLRPVRAVHHQAGNFQVRLRGEAAEAFCYAIAIHYLPNPKGSTRTFVGSYEFELRKDDAWRVTKFRFNLKWIEGNAELEKGAG